MSSGPPADRLAWDEIGEITWPQRGFVIMANIPPSQWLVRVGLVVGVAFMIIGTLVQPGLVGRPLLALAVIFAVVACVNPQFVAAPLVYLCVAVPWTIDPAVGAGLLLVVTGFALYQASLSLAGTAPPTVAVPWVVARPYVIAAVVLAALGVLAWVAVRLLLAAAAPGLLVVGVGALLLIAAFAFGIVRGTRR